jgi:hypothetical protein
VSRSDADAPQQRQRLIEERLREGELLPARTASSAYCTSDGCAESQVGVDEWTGCEYRGSELQLTSSPCKSDPGICSFACIVSFEPLVQPSILHPASAVSSG